MKEIQLTQGKVALVDDEDYEEISRKKWQAQWDEHTQGYYAVRHYGRRIDRRVDSMHRIIAKTPKNMCCDHINHDTLDNRKENLRNVTHSQNMMNRRGAQSNNKLGERGIRRNGTGFQVRVIVMGSCVYDKTFRTIEEAISARDNAIREHHTRWLEAK